VQPTTEQRAFTADDAAQTLSRVCQAKGLDERGAELMRMGENALFLLPHNSLVVRIARGRSRLADVENEVAVAQWLEAVGYPAVRLFPGMQQPATFGDSVVSFWSYVKGTGRKATMPELAVLLRRLHDLGTDQRPSLPEFDPLAYAEERIHKADSVTDTDLDFLKERLGDLRDSYAQLDFALEPGHIHGDAHPGNVLFNELDEPLLHDFERFSFGPREWDICIAGVHVRSLGWIDEKEYSEFVAAYGFDVTQWSGFEVLRGIREFQMTTWLMQNIDHSSDTRAEFEVRVASLRSGNSRRTWRPF
jgi:Ser/Thr protein kinase RdoA (MazF antagonist)